MPVIKSAVQSPEADSNAKDGDNSPSSTTTNDEVKIEIRDEEASVAPQDENQPSQNILRSPKLSPDPSNVTNFTKNVENNVLQNELQTGMQKSEIKTEEESSKTKSDENEVQNPAMHTSTPAEQPENGILRPKENKDCEVELAELMRASSTIATPQPRKSVCASNKRTRQAREVEATLTLLQSDLDPVTRDKKEHEIALGYLTKVQDELSKAGEAGETQFKTFIETLQGAEEVLQQPGGVTKLYSQVCDALIGYEHLASEFLIFLEPGQALACNNFSQHQQLTAMMDFISKIQVHFCRQPSVLRMLISTLTSMAERSEVSGEEVQAAVLPLLKGVPPMLTECFLRLLPSAKPPESCTDEYAELMYDDLGDDEEPVETLTLPLEHNKDDACVCTCHQQQLINTKLKYRTDHCVRCGLKFIHGKVFVHNGRNLRSARVTFLNEDMDSAIKRLTVQSTTGRSSVARCRKRNGNSFSQDSINVNDSPPKLANEESDNENFKNFSSPKSSRKKRKSKHIFSEVVAKSEELSREVKTASPNEAKQLSSPTSSSCEALRVSRKSEESPTEPDSTVPCDEEQVVSSKELPEEQMDVEEEQNRGEEEEDTGSKEEQKTKIHEELEYEEDGSREEQNRDTCEELDEEEDEEEERGSRGSREEQNRDTCEELDDEEEERGSRGSREEQNRDTCEELDEEEDEEEERGSRGSREEQNRDTCEELEDEELELELEEEESRRLENRDICNELGEEEEEEEELDLDLELDEEEESREQGTELGEELGEDEQEPGEEQCEELGEEEEEEMEMDEELEDEEELEEEQYFDESSQETEELEQEEPSSSVGSPDKDPCWTRDEDKAILQAFQQGGTAQRMLLTVRQLLPERTPDQIMSRFHILLKLLQQMSSAARESNRK